MVESKGVYGTNSSDARRKWDKEEYEKKAKLKDEQERERMQENEALKKQGKRPRLKPKEDVPKPTELMKQREGSLELDKNLGQTMIVTNAGGRGPGQPGFYCEVCSRNHKDSAGYLDHINSRAHLRKLGQTTRIARSTVEQVRARIAFLREKTKEASSAKSFDFEQRLAQIKAQEEAVRKQKREKQLQEKEAQRLAMINGAGEDD
ncbi:hypothetical protein SISNIDRAFT_478370, partial [Sistotremastrum niveocremeum HHB9708]